MAILRNLRNKTKSRMIAKLFVQLYYNTNFEDHRNEFSISQYFAVLCLLEGSKSFLGKNILVTLHSVNPPTARGLPVATLINWLPDSDHFHSCLSDPVNDHNSSLVENCARARKRGERMVSYLSTPA